MAARAGRYTVATGHLERAIELYEGQNMPHPAARALSRLGLLESVSGQLDQSVQRMERAFAVLASDPPDEDLATLAARLGSLLLFKGDTVTSAKRIETALDIAEKLGLPDILSQALNVKAMHAMQHRHGQEAMALYAHALKLGLDNDLPMATIRAYSNLADLLCHRDRYMEALEHYRSALALSRKIGDRSFERSTSAELAFNLTRVGEWDEAVEFAAAITDDEIRNAPTDVLSLFGFGEMYIHRGQAGELEKWLSWTAHLATSDDWQVHSTHLAFRACLRHAQERDAEALEDAEDAIKIAAELGGTAHQNIKLALPVACEAAFALHDIAKVEELLAFVDRLGPGERSRDLYAMAMRFRARLADVKGDAAAVEPAFAEAEETFSQLGMPFWLAVVRLEHAEWLVANGRHAEAGPMLAEAMHVFERLRARPWIDRVTRSAPAALAAS